MAITSTSMTDLVTRLLAAITQRENDAHRGTDAVELISYQWVDPLTSAFRREPDPDVLRRCAADREIVGLHSADEGRHCLTCHGHAWQVDEGDGHRYTEWEGALSPCPTLISLARGYGITEES